MQNARGVVAKTTAAYCRVKDIVYGSDDGTGLSASAIGVGLATDADVFDTVAVHCEVEVKRGSGAGIGVGRRGKVGGRSFLVQISLLINKTSIVVHNERLGPDFPKKTKR